ncbi:MAG: VTT domain-containing protein [Candidatus Hodarchaeota archaeon]
MAVPKKLIIVFTFFYLAIIIYLFLFLFLSDFQDIIIKSRENLASITQGPNYFWALLVSLIICFLGSASIGFPIPFPFVLFSISNSIYLKYLNRGLLTNQILASGSFWLEISGIAIIGGLGSALGELSGYIVGYGAKRIAEERNSNIIANIDGFGKLILENRKRTPFYIFIFALTPLPDDLLFIPLGMIKYPFWKSIIPGWIGKNVITIIYCLWPIFIALGFAVTGGQPNDISSVITEALMLLLTISFMFFIMAFNWNKYLNKRKQKKLNNYNKNEVK